MNTVKVAAILTNAFKLEKAISVGDLYFLETWANSKAVDSVVDDASPSNAPIWIKITDSDNKQTHL